MKKATFKVAFFHAQDEVKSGLVDELLDSVLGVADRLLRSALELLHGA